MENENVSENIDENVIGTGIIDVKGYKKNRTLDIILIVNFTIIVILMILIFGVYVTVNYMGKYYEDLEITHKFDKIKNESIYSLGILNLDTKDELLKSKVVLILNDIIKESPLISKVSDYDKFKKINIKYTKYDMNEKVESILANIDVECRNKVEKYKISVSRLKKNNSKIGIKNIIRAECMEDFKKKYDSKGQALDYNNFILFNDSVRIFYENKLDYIDITYNDIDEYLQNGIFTKENVLRYDEIFKGQINPYEPMIALTFDDGPTRANTRRILNTLTKYDSKATFFVVGYMVDGNPDMLKEIVNQRKSGR